MLASYVSPAIRVTGVTGVTGKMGERFPVTAVTPVTEVPVCPREAVCAALSGWAEEVPITGEIGHVWRLWTNPAETTDLDKMVRGAGTWETPTVPVGQASRPAIRRAALAGAKPRHPLPLKGKKERYAEEENGDHHSKDDAGE